MESDCARAQHAPEQVCGRFQFLQKAVTESFTDRPSVGYRVSDGEKTPAAPMNPKIFPWNRDVPSSEFVVEMMDVFERGE
jgi:hypothetical protein